MYYSLNTLKEALLKMLTKLTPLLLYSTFLRSKENQFLLWVPAKIGDLSSYRGMNVWNSKCSFEELRLKL